MTNPTPREIQLVEAALESAAAWFQKYRSVIDIRRIHEEIRSLDPAAIVASVPEPTEHPEEAAMLDALIHGTGAYIQNPDGSREHIPYQNFQVALSAQEQVEPTDASLLELAAKHGIPVITKAGHYPWSYIQPLLDFARALLSANQGK